MCGRRPLPTYSRRRPATCAQPTRDFGLIVRVTDSRLQLRVHDRGEQHRGTRRAEEYAHEPAVCPRVVVPRVVEWA